MADEKNDFIEIKIPSREEELSLDMMDEEKPLGKGKDQKEEQKKLVVKEAPAHAKHSLKKKKGKMHERETIAPKVAKKTKSKDGGNNNWLWIVLLVIGFAVIAAVIFLSLQGKVTSQTEEKRIAALVNSKPIYQDEVDEIFNNLPESLGTFDKETILDQLIEQELMIQEAEKQGITVSDEELNAYILELLQYFGIAEADFEAALSAQNMSREDFEYNSKRQLIVNKLVNETIYESIDVSEDALQARYNQDQQYFAIPAQSIVKHILLTAKENETDDELKSRAKKVKNKVDDDFANFCDLVKEFTADMGSVETCGEYKVAQNGQFVKEFEEAAFEMDDGDLALVKTEFGYHVIWKVGEQEAGIMPFADVKESIKGLIFQEQASSLLAQYVASLRDNAVIEKYPGEKEIETAPLTVEKEKEQEKEMQVEIEETKPVRQGNFGKCLAEKGAVFYGVEWAPGVKEQQEILGEAFTEINYVDCDPKTGAIPTACDSISVYPTWIVGDKVLKGKQSVNALAKETGCTA
jgi:foldase protein PrsA